MKYTLITARGRVMTFYVLAVAELYRTIEGGDVDGTGPERWAGTAVAWFDTADEAYAFVDTHWAECEVVEE